MRLTNFGKKCGMCIIHLRVVLLRKTPLIEEQNSRCGWLRELDVETTRLKCVILAKSHEGFVLAL